MNKNQQVTLSSANGRITRIVVEDLGEVIRVCRPEELARATAEAREPVAIAFRKADIVPGAR